MKGAAVAVGLAGLGPVTTGVALEELRVVQHSKDLRPLADVVANPSGRIALSLSLDETPAS